MAPKVKTNLGRFRFEARMTRKSDIDPLNNGSATTRVTLAAPGEVLYAPYKVPGWKQKIANHQDATSVLIGTISKSKSTEYKFRTVYGYPGGLLDETVGSGEILATSFTLPTSAPSTDPLAQALAAENFIKRYYEKTRSLRGASSLAEAGSTIRGLASPAKALRTEISNLYASLTKRLYRSSGTQVKDGAKVIAGTWLEWQFGISPLISDVDGAAEAVNKMANGNFNCSVPIKGAGRSVSNQQMLTNQGIVSASNDATGPYSVNFGTADVGITESTRCIIRGSINVYPPGSEVPPVMQFGVGVEDVAPAVWEAIPWSFFIDYFINVSSVIDAWSFLESRLAWCNRTLINESRISISDVKPHPDDRFGDFFQRYQASGGHAEATYTQTIRSPVTWSDVAPSLRVKLPTGGIKWANIAALMTMGKLPRGSRGG